MKALVQSIYNNPKYARLFEWGRLISIISGAQIIIQGIGLVSGILVIRLLPTQEYALYTLANTMLGTMVVLADGGIANSVVAQGGKVWQDKVKLGKVVVTGYDLRKKFAIGSLLIAVPILLYLLKHHQASWLMAILITLALIPAFITTLSGSLLSVGPVLHQAIAPLKKNEVIASGSRLILILTTLFVLPWAFVAVFVSGLPQIWANIRLREISENYADWHQKPDVEIRKRILDFVKRIMPGSIYYSVSGQITIWLISVFGTTASVAQIGALSRFGMMLSLFSMLFGSLIVPRYARLPNDKKKLLKRFLQAQFGLLLLSGAIILFAALFPKQLLLILGKNYTSLENELILSVIGSCLGLITGSLFTLSSSRGWALNPVISIPLTLLAITSGAAFIDVSNLSGILKFNLFVATTEVGIYLIYCLIKIFREKTLTL